MRIDWDLVALMLASLAVVLRLLDHPRASGIVSSCTLLAATVAGWSARRRHADLAAARRDRRPYL